MRVTENTSQGANARRGRLRRTASALPRTVKKLAEKANAFFDKLKNAGRKDRRFSLPVKGEKAFCFLLGWLMEYLVGRAVLHCFSVVQVKSGVCNALCLCQ